MSKYHVGQEVFVVHQRQLGEQKQRTHLAQVVRVGRKYAYITSEYCRESPVDLNTGYSVHPNDHNAWGFSVYSSQSEWEAILMEREELRRLNDRLNHRDWGVITKLDHGQVMAIHAILDNKGGE